MKNFKRFCLVPFLALSMGTISSCYNVSDEDCECEDVVCKEETKTIDEAKGMKISKDGHTLSVDRKEIKVLVDAEIGKVKHIVASATPSSDTITYSSSDTSVATVDENGVITGKKANSSCKITIKSSGDVSLEIDIKTYSVDTYFVIDYIRSGTNMSTEIKGIVDRDVEELEFPKNNPSNGATIVRIAECFYDNIDPNDLLSYEFSKLKKIIIPEGYTTLKDAVFSARAPKCEELSLPSTLTDIGTFVLDGLCNLKNIVFPNSNTKYSVSTSQVNGAKVLYTGTTAYKCFNYPGTGPIFDEDLGITTIGQNCIYNMDKLVNLIIPNSVTSIRSKGIYYNRNLKDLTLPSSLSTSLIESIYANESLEGIHFPEGVNWLYNNRYTNRNKKGEEANCIVDVASSSGFVYLLCGTKKMNFDDEFPFPTGSAKAHITSTYSYCCLNIGLEGIIKLPSSITSLGSAVFSFNNNLKGIYFPRELTLPIDNPCFDHEYVSRTANTPVASSQFYFPYNNGELPFTPRILFCGGYSNISSFYGADDDFAIYYQTRADGKSFAEAFPSFRNGLVNGNKGFFKLVEVADSNLTPVY